MQLRRPPHPEIVDTATYFGIHALHRADAVRDAAALIRESHQADAASKGGEEWAALVGPHWEWVIESLVQGAYVRGYHEWEKATKAYFGAQNQRAGSQAPTWRENLPGVPGASHVDRVRTQIALFGATGVADAIEVIDRARLGVNRAKHDADILASEEDFDLLASAIQEFWDALTEQEEFTPPAAAR